MAPPLDDADDARQVARLRVAVETGRLPRDLGDWLLAELSPAAARRQERDVCLRAAAQWVRGGPWARARALQAAVQGQGKGEPRAP